MLDSWLAQFAQTDMKIFPVREMEPEQNAAEPSSIKERGRGPEGIKRDFNGGLRKKRDAART